MQSTLALTTLASTTQKGINCSHSCSLSNETNIPLKPYYIPYISLFNSIQCKEEEREELTRTKVSWPRFESITWVAIWYGPARSLLHASYIVYDILDHWVKQGAKHKLFDKKMLPNTKEMSSQQNRVGYQLIIGQLVAQVSDPCCSHNIL